MNTESLKGKPCPYKPILCQEGFCQDCQIYLDFKGHQGTMGRTTHGSITPRWLEAQEREQGDKLEILRGVIKIKRDEAFVESSFGSREKKMQMQTAVNTYDVVLKLIKKALGGK